MLPPHTVKGLQAFQPSTARPTEPPSIPDAAWPEDEAKADLGKCIDNILYYEALLARYNAARRSMGPEAYDEGWAQYEDFANKSTVYWLRTRIKLETERIEQRDRDRDRDRGASSWTG